MPVVSQSISSPIVPVGASTEAWALRTPWRTARSTASSQACWAASRMSAGAFVTSIWYEASRCIRSTLIIGSAFSA